jgi:hypothetical protein
VDRLLGEKGIARDSVAGRKELARRKESRRREERNPEDDAVRRGWCLGSEEFRRELLEAARERAWAGATMAGSVRPAGRKRPSAWCGGNSIGGARRKRI